MEGIVIKGFFRRILLGALIILFLVSPSFSQAPPEKGGALSIQKIEVAETDKGSRVMIEGSRPFEYSATRLENPLRVIVKLPDAQLKKLAGSIQVENGIIKVIRNSQIEDPRNFGARVEIGLEQNVDYNLLSEGNFLYVDLSRPKIISAPKVEEKVASVEPQAGEKGAPAEKPLKGAKFLKDLEISAKADWVRVEIRGDGLIPDYQSFQLGKPSRLVVDLPRMMNAYPKKSIDVGSKLLKDIRIGQHPNRLRVVFTFPEPQFPPSQLTKEGQNLIVLLGRMPEELPKKEIVPAAEVPKPIRVAEAEPKGEAQRPEAAAPAPMEKPAMEEKELPVEMKPAAEVKPPAEVKAAEETKPPAEEVKPPVEAKAAEEAKPPVEAEAAEEVKPPVEAKPVEEVKPSVEAKAVEEAKPPTEVKAAEKPLATRYKGQKISLDFKDADIHNILRLIGEVSNLNIITSDDVKGKITIRLMTVPWDQALDVILSAKNLIKLEEGNIIRITTVDNVRKEMDDKRKEEETLIRSIENRENAEEMVTETFRLNYAKALDLQRVIMGAMVGAAMVPGMGPPKPLLSTRGSVRADERTNTLIIRDTRARIQEIQVILRKLDLPTPQVLIEARVVQATTSFIRALGIQWGGGYTQTGTNWNWGLTGNNPTAAAGWGFTPSSTSITNQTFPYAATPVVSPNTFTGPSNIAMPSNFVVNFPAPTANTPTGGIGISFGKLTGSLVNLDMRLSLGETDSQVRVISRPKLATLDYKEAIIKQGSKIPYETTSAAGTQVQFIDAVLALNVTPHVTPDGSILMAVKVNRDAQGTYRSPTVQVPSIDTREARTEVLVKDGETLVIGGIYESTSSEIFQGIPWLMQIPILGWLFKNQEVQSIRDELLIFITPTIIRFTKTES